MEFSYKIIPDGDTTYVELKGRLMDKSQAADMLSEIEKEIREGRNKIILGMNAMEYMNSSGLNVLVNILTKARSASGEVVVSELNPKLKELFLMTKLNTLFTILDTKEAAKNHFQNNNQ